MLVESLTELSWLDSLSNTPQVLSSTHRSGAVWKRVMCHARREECTEISMQYLVDNCACMHHTILAEADDTLSVRPEIEKNDAGRQMQFIPTL